MGVETKMGTKNAMKKMDTEISSKIGGFKLNRCIGSEGSIKEF
jgi:hypothetical protein